MPLSLSWVCVASTERSDVQPFQLEYNFAFRFVRNCLSTSSLRSLTAGCICIVCVLCLYSDVCLLLVRLELQSHLRQLVGDNQLLSHCDRLPCGQGLKQHLFFDLLMTAGATVSRFKETRNCVKGWRKDWNVLDVLFWRETSSAHQSVLPLPFSSEVKSECRDLLSIDLYSSYNMLLYVY